MKPLLLFIGVMSVLNAYDLSSALAEPDLGKRSELALMHADQEIDAARSAYEAGDLKAYNAALSEVRESADLAFESLSHFNKNPRKSRQHKAAELKVRGLLRRLNTLRDDVSVDDRKPVEDLQKRLQEVHDELLTEVMGKRT